MRVEDSEGMFRWLAQEGLGLILWMALILGGAQGVSQPSTVGGSGLAVYRGFSGLGAILVHKEKTSAGLP